MKNIMSTFQKYCSTILDVLIIMVIGLLTILISAFVWRTGNQGTVLLSCPLLTMFITFAIFNIQKRIDMIRQLILFESKWHDEWSDSEIVTYFTKNVNKSLFGTIFFRMAVGIVFTELCVNKDEESLNELFVLTHSLFIKDDIVEDTLKKLETLRNK